MPLRRIKLTSWFLFFCVDSLEVVSVKAVAFPPNMVSIGSEVEDPRVDDLITFLNKLSVRQVITILQQIGSSKQVQMVSFKRYDCKWLDKSKGWIFIKPIHLPKINQCPFVIIINMIPDICIQSIPLDLLPIKHINIIVEVKSSSIKWHDIAGIYRYFQTATV